MGRFFLIEWRVKKVLGDLFTNVLKLNNDRNKNRKWGVTINKRK